MKPALFINDLKNRGAERLVVDLAIEMQSYKNIEPVVIVASATGELVSKLTTSDVEIISLEVDVSTLSIPEGVWSLIRVLRAHDIDVVHSHLPFSHVVGRLACARCRVPHVSTYHNVREHKTRPRRLAERTTGRLSERIVCVSEGVCRSYPDSGRTVVIYNAIDVETFNRQVARADTSELPPHDGETVLLNVAHCAKQKRQQDLISAVSRLDAHDVHLYIVGEGPRRELLDELVDKHDLSDRITVTGYVEAIEPYYAVADAFVSSSSKEGLPTTHIEAMAAKLPIVSTNIPGVREIVEDETTGYLCPVSDPKALAASMKRVHGGDHRTLGSRGFEVATTTFSLDRIADDHVALYREVT